MLFTDEEIYTNGMEICNEVEYQTTKGSTHYVAICNRHEQTFNFRIPQRDGGTREERDCITKDRFIQWYKVYRLERLEGRNGNNRNLYRNAGIKQSKTRKATYFLPVFEKLFSIETEQQL
uniref:Uncharacterized protein n=1 Tax=Cyanothece sp. (strain PCC 7425 / ATCC 29141) TaxID=395961 RepID=B8HP63_CYAP4